MAFRVMSFNLRGAGRPQDGANDWPGRKALNLATLRTHAPDLIGFQELEDGHLRTYDAELTEYRHILGNRASDTEHPSIFWKPAALDLLESGSFWLSETPDVYSGAWDTDCVRACTWARFAEKSSGAAFLHFNTHLDHRSGWARTEGLRLILRRMAELRGELPVVLTGDFNANAYDPRSAEGAALADPNYRYLLEQGFADSYLAAGNADSAQSNTFHGFHGTSFNPDRPGNAGRIDWLMTLDGAQRWQVRASGIIRDHNGDVYPSDHYPIFADVALG